MRLIALLAVLAIIYLAYGNRLKEQGPQARVAEAQAEVAKMMPQQPVAVPQRSGGLRGPVDTTRSVLQQVHGRNSE